MKEQMAKKGSASIARAAKIISNPATQSTPRANALLAKFGVAVAARRRQLGMGQTEMSRDIGCTVSQVSNMEAGRNWPSMTVYFKLCRVLQVETPPFFK